MSELSPDLQKSFDNYAKILFNVAVEHYASEGVSREMLLSKSRKSPLPDIRQFIAIILKNKFFRGGINVGCDTLAHLFDSNRATVLNRLRKHNELIKVNKKHRAEFEKFQNLAQEAFAKIVTNSESSA